LAFIFPLKQPLI